MVLQCQFLTFPLPPLHLFMLVRVGLGCRIKSNCLYVKHRSMEGVLFVGVFLRDPSPYLSEFWRKPRKTPNDQVDKCDRGLNMAPPVYQF